MAKLTRADRDKAITDLRAILVPGETVYTTLRHRSRSGMLRVIDCHVIQDGGPRWIGYRAAKAIGVRYDDKRNGLRVGGCGMDMGFHVVYELSSVLFADGFQCVGRNQDTRDYGCPSNDHSNGDRNYQPHLHKDGGYALRHRWL